MSLESLKSYWHPIATIGEIGSQPKRFDLLGERIVAYRDSLGLVAFKDLCIHRGAALSGGRVENDEIVCPYHGWRYDRTGACTRIPSLPDGASIPVKARAITYAAREAYGLVWVRMKDSDHDLPAWPDDAWERGDYHVCYVGRYVWEASAARIVENVLDFSHFNFVHKGFTELADGPIIKPYDVKRTPSGLQFAYEDGAVRREYSLHFPYAVHDRKLVIDGASTATWSSSADSSNGDVTILTFIAAPLGETRTSIYVFVGRNHALDRPDTLFTGGFDAIMEQDRVIVESQHPEQVPVDLVEELHVRYPDAASVAYRRMLRDLDLVAAG